MKKEFVFGEGKISGYLAIVMSSMALFAVFCFHFPEYLTTPELRAIYPIPFIRTLIALFIFSSFTLGIVSVSLSSSKLLGLIGILFSLIAMALGGSQVSTPEHVYSKRYVGLDWFILDLLIVTMIFIPIEKIFYRLKQNIFRKNWKLDMYYFMVSHLLIQVTSYLILLPSLALGSHIANAQLQAVIKSQPIFLQFLEVIVVADFAQYCVHRLFHQIPFLWKFHSIHHTIEVMDWFAGSRLHLVDIIFTRGLTLIPLFILGFDQKALNLYLIFVAFWATFIHVNIRYKFKFLQPYFVTPLFHHWHHGAHKEAINKNFSVHLPIYDKLFGTYYLPNKWPEKYGLGE